MTGEDQQRELDRGDRGAGAASGAEAAAGVREVLRELSVYLVHGIEERSRWCTGGAAGPRRRGNDDFSEERHLRR